MKPHLVFVFPAFGGGGPEVRTCEIINRTAGTFRHTVISLSDDISARANLDPRCEVKCVALAKTTLWKLAHTLRSLRPDLLLTHGWGGTDAIVAARLAGIRKIIHLEDGFLDDEVHLQKPARRFARRVLFQAASTLIVPSRTLRKIAHKQWKVAQRRIKYIPNGVDTERFCLSDFCNARDLRTSMGLAQDAIVVGTVGGLCPEKNQMRLVRAFAHIVDEVPNAHLLIVGNGPLLDEIKREASALRIENRVTFCGRIEEPSKHYHVMDIFALSSDTEQMPLVVLEAMSSGLPIVSTDVGDVRRMLTPLNQRWISPAHDELAFADSLTALALKQDLRLELGALNRRKCIARYSMDRMLSKYVTLFQQSTTCMSN